MMKIVQWLCRWWKCIQYCKGVPSDELEKLGLKQLHGLYCEALDDMGADEMEIDERRADIRSLADYIMADVDGEPSQSEGACRCAIRIMKALQANIHNQNDVIVDVHGQLERVEKDLHKQIDRTCKARGQRNALQDAIFELLNFIVEKHQVADVAGFTCPHLRKIATLVGWKAPEERVVEVEQVKPDGGS